MVIVIIKSVGGRRMKIICTNCKADLPKDAKFCSDCGTQVPQEEKGRQKNPAILMPEEAMSFLRISRSTFYQLLGREKDPIPYFPIGRHKRFITEELWHGQSEIKISLGLMNIAGLVKG
jgi:predicted nucleic acid-binding Zn ribbon protein